MTPRRAAGQALFALALLLTPSCVYSRVKIPLDVDLDRTELGAKTGEASSQSLLWLVAWGDSGMQAAAQNGGLETLNHADQKVFSILFGLYSRQTTVVYGD